MNLMYKGLVKALAFITVTAVFMTIAGGCSIQKTDNQPSDEVLRTDGSDLSTDNVTDDVTETEQNDMNESTAPEETIEIVSEKNESAAPEETVEIVSGNAAKWIENYKNSGKNGDVVILSEREIKEFNESLTAECDYLVDILNMPMEIAAETVKKKIENAGYPSLPKYDWSGEEITYDILHGILELRNTAALRDGELIEMKRGIVVNRADLRTLPTEKPFFSQSGETYYDRIQETELVVGSPVLIMHESSDSKYYYVQAYHYAGWVIKDEIAIAESVSAWTEFASPADFAVVTDTLVTVSDTKLDMGVSLPIEERVQDGFNIKLPKRSSDGNLYSETAFLPKSVSYEGYLSYTMNNFYKQAFKYEGSIYGWGGMYDSVDCSGFVSSVMRSFGFMLPRNAGQQKDSVGQIFNLNEIGRSEVEARLSEADTPAAIYKPGHVMLYLGEIDGVHYIIHSPSGGKTVCEAALDTSAANLLSINLIK